jgi:hypothetical protein
MQRWGDQLPSELTAIIGNLLKQSGKPHPSAISEEQHEKVGFIRPVCCWSADKLNEQYGGVEGQLPLAGPTT